MQVLLKGKNEGNSLEIHEILSSEKIKSLSFLKDYEIIETQEKNNIVNYYEFDRFYYCLEIVFKILEIETNNFNIKEINLKEYELKGNSKIIRIYLGFLSICKKVYEMTQKNENDLKRLEFYEIDFINEKDFKNIIELLESEKINKNFMKIIEKFPKYTKSEIAENNKNILSEIAFYKEHKNYFDNIVEFENDLYYLKKELDYWMQFKSIKEILLNFNKGLNILENLFLKLYEKNKFKSYWISRVFNIYNYIGLVFLGYCNTKIEREEY